MGDLGLILAVVAAVALAAGRRFRWLVGFVAVYALVLIGVSLVTPRRSFAPGERRCFDDWCVTADSARKVGGEWETVVVVSSDAKRVRQRGFASVELEDGRGRRYAAAVEPEPPLSGELGPGESFRSRIVYRLPEGVLPAGLVVSHGSGPGKIVIGDDAAFLHPPALARVTISE